ncbi:MAG: hypothetical protein ACK559_18480, partial [bacterium]
RRARAPESGRPVGPGGRLPASGVRGRGAPPAIGPDSPRASTCAREPGSPDRQGRRTGAPVTGAGEHALAHHARRRPAAASPAAPPFTRDESPNCG